MPDEDFELMDSSFDLVTTKAMLKRAKISFEVDGDKILIAGGTCMLFSSYGELVSVFSFTPED